MSDSVLGPESTPVPEGLDSVSPEDPVAVFSGVQFCFQAFDLDCGQLARFAYDFGFLYLAYKQASSSGLAVTEIIFEMGTLLGTTMENM